MTSSSSSSSELSYAEVLELELELELEDELELELEDELELELVHFAPGVDGERQSAALNNIRKKEKRGNLYLKAWQTGLCVKPTSLLASASFLASEPFSIPTAAPFRRTGELAFRTLPPNARLRIEMSIVNHVNHINHDKSRK